MRHNERAQWEGLRSSSMNASRGPWPGGHGLFIGLLHPGWMSSVRCLLCL